MANWKVEICRNSEEKNILFVRRSTKITFVAEIETFTLILEMAS